MQKFWKKKSKSHPLKTKNAEKVLENSCDFNYIPSKIYETSIYFHEVEKNLSYLNFIAVGFAFSLVGIK